ncbi:hypothetical protein STENM223S_03686 [Streptomyces tendae]
MVGGSLGLATLTVLAAGRTDALRYKGAEVVGATAEGYQLAFRVAAVFAAGALVLAALCCGRLVRKKGERPAGESLRWRPGSGSPGPGSCFHPMKVSSVRLPSFLAIRSYSGPDHQRSKETLYSPSIYVRN